MSDLKDKYREEFNKDVYYENPEDCGAWCYTVDYVQWLEKQVKLFAIPVVSCSLCGRGITAKQSETEAYVLEFTKENGKPPTYRQIAKHFKIQVNSAYVRMKPFRHLMRGGNDS